MKSITVSEKLNDLLHFSRNCFTGYPYCGAKDPGYFELLLEEFIELDLLQELKFYYAWTLDTTELSSIPYRTVFRQWLMHSRSVQKLRTFSDRDDRC